MDPDKALRQIRILLQGVAAGPSAETLVHGDQAAMVWWRNLARDIAENFTNLDEWLSRGGFVPQDWRDN